MKKQEKLYLTIGLAVVGLLLLTKGRGNEMSNDEILLNLSYLDEQGLPLGMRRNNPGNIVKGSGYEGEMIDDDNRFAKFRSWSYGIRAMIKLLIKYITTGSNYPNPCVSEPQNTVTDIIRQWAPPYSCGGDNKDDVVNKYIAFVAKRVGISPNATLKANKSTLRKLVRAMAFYEQGQDCITDQQFNATWTFYFE